MRAPFKVLALAGALSGAVMAQAQAPLSPWANVVDLNGRYMAPSPGSLNGPSDGIALVNTQASGGNVTETSNGFPAQENTFTPFSDSFKKPMPQTTDLRGHSFSADIDLLSPAQWAGTTGNEAFVVGTGTTFGSSGPTGVVVEARYYWPTPNDPHAQFRLRTTVSTGSWMDAGSYGDRQVNGSYTVRVDVSPAGDQATMIVTPKPTLLPPPPWVYGDVVDQQPANVSGPVPFVAGFWTSGTPGTTRGSARIVRMVSNDGEMAMWLKATAPYITSQYGLSQGATAPLSTEFHLGMSNLEYISRGYQASGIYYGSVWGYLISPMIMDSTAIQDQSYFNPVAGPFTYLKSPYVFTATLWNSIVPGSYGFSNFRVSGAAAPGTPSLNTDAELCALPVGPINPEPMFNMSGGAVWVHLVETDPEGILGITGCARDNGELVPAIVRGSDVVLVDEIKPMAIIDGGGVTQGSTNLIPFSGPAANAYQGTVTVKFYAKDNGNYMAATGSGLGATPEAIVERQSTEDGWVLANDLTVFPMGDNMFTGTWTITNDTPCGDYRVRLRAIDRVGLVSPEYVTRYFHVQTLKSVVVNISLQGLVGSSNANNQRLIRFMLGSAPGTPVPPGGSTSPRTVIDQLVRFNAGQATLTFAYPQIPSCDARNLVIWIKDLQHTTATALPPQNGIVGSEYVANLTLRSGDVNNDNVVNFTDYAMFIADYGKVAPRDMTSMSWYRNCDFNGSGQVDFTDWTMFYPNYGTVGAVEPADFTRAFTAQRSGNSKDADARDPKLERMTVKQLVSLGVPDAPKWDTNRDGWVDKGELDRAFQLKRLVKPLPKPTPRN